MNKLSCIIAVVVFALYVDGMTVERLPVPGFVDTEVTAHHLLDQPSTVSFLDFSLVFNGTASNNVEVAFGHDADADGELAPHETDVVIGWECGRYFIENFKTGETVGDANVGTNGIERSLDWHYHVRGGRTVLESFAATNEVGAAFVDISANRPAWLYGGDWNLMRLTARGVDVQDERFEIEVRTKGFFIHLR